MRMWFRYALRTERSGLLNHLYPERLDFLMGRTLPPVTQLVLAQISEVKSLYAALRRSDQLVLDDFFDSVQQHRAAIANAASLLPLEAMFLLMLMEARKREAGIHAELYQEVERLRQEIRALKEAGP